MFWYEKSSVLHGGVVCGHGFWPVVRVVGQLRGHMHVGCV